MPIIASDGGGDFELAPEGVHHVVCVDVVDLGIQEVDFNGQKQKLRKVRVVWEIPSENTSKGDPFTVSKRYTLSLNERAALRKDLESWRGRAFDATELKGFDLEKLLGVNGFANVQQKANQAGKVFSNVVSVMPLAKGMAKVAPSGKYVRWIDRPENNQAPPTSGEHAADPDDDNSVPF